MRYASLVAWTPIVVLLTLGSPAPGSAETATPAARKAPALKVHIKDYAFKPAVATVSVGDVVEFVNDDDDTHTVTALNGSFDSKGLGEKGRFSYTFAKAASYQYGCTIHTNMRGTIVVRPAGKATP